MSEDIPFCRDEKAPAVDEIEEFPVLYLALLAVVRRVSLHRPLRLLLSGCEEFPESLPRYGHQGGHLPARGSGFASNSQAGQYCSHGDSAVHPEALTCFLVRAAEEPLVPDVLFLFSRASAASRITGSNPSF